MFFIGAKKQKIDFFFRNDLKSLRKGPKHPKMVFKCHFAVFYGDCGLGDFGHFGMFLVRFL